MKLLGKLTSLTRDWTSGKTIISLVLDADTDAQKLEELKGDTLLDIELKKHRNGRSPDANKLLWACIGEIAEVLKTDTWSVYLYLLKRYGKYEHVFILQEAVEDFKKQWREVEVVGEYEGKADVLCYYGSHIYNTREFSRLLEGTFDEMNELGLQPPPSMEMRRALEQWQKRYQS